VRSAGRTGAKPGSEVNTDVQDHAPRREDPFRPGLPRLPARPFGRLSHADSPAHAELVARYSAPSRRSTEVYTFLLGIREAGCPLSSPDELLEQAYRELGMEASP